MALDGRVLLLNQTYEPLGTVSVARAIIMTLKNSVFVEEYDGVRVLRSAHDEFPVPSVIRRRTDINSRRRREQSGMQRLRIYMRDKFRCQYCGDKKSVNELTLDHILPRSRGGNSCTTGRTRVIPGEASASATRAGTKAGRRSDLILTVSTRQSPMVEARIASSLRISGTPS